jgi:hypothetical protein
MWPGDQPARPAREGADKHYASPAPTDHSREERARSANRPEHVDRHHAIEICVPARLVPIVVPWTDRCVENQGVDFADLPGKTSIAARALTSATKAAAFPPISRRRCPRRGCRQEAVPRRASRRPSPSLLRCRRRRRLSGCVVQSNRKRFSLSSSRRGGRVPSIAIALRKTREADGENEHRAVERFSTKNGAPSWVSPATATARTATARTVPQTLGRPGRIAVAPRSAPVKAGSINSCPTVL